MGCAEGNFGKNVRIEVCPNFLVTKMISEQLGTFETASPFGHTALAVNSPGRRLSGKAERVATSAASPRKADTGVDKPPARILRPAVDQFLGVDTKLIHTDSMR